MAHELGLKNTLREKIMEPYWNFRGDETTNTPGIPCGFNEFMRDRPDGGEKLVNTRGEPLTLEGLYREMGKGPYEVYLNNLIARDDDFALLFGPILEEPIMRGYRQAEDGQDASWMQLCAATGVPVAQESLKRTVQEWQGEPKFTGEGEDLPVVTIKQGDEVIAWKKKGVRIMFTLEYLKNNAVPQMEDFLFEQGLILQHQEFLHCVRTISQGDLPNGGNASPVIGVADTGAGIAYLDFVRPWIRGSLIGRKWFTVISGEEMANKFETIEEFTKPVSGSVQIDLKKRNRPIPTTMDHFVCDEIGANISQLLDKRSGVRQRVYLPLHTEDARNPGNLTRGVSVAVSTTFEKINDQACVAIDESLAFADNGFPDWFKLGGGRNILQAA